MHSKDNSLLHICTTSAPHGFFQRYLKTSESHLDESSCRRAKPQHQQHAAPERTSFGPFSPVRHIGGVDDKFLDSNVSSCVPMQKPPNSKTSMANARMIKWTRKPMT